MNMYKKIKEYKRGTLFKNSNLTEEEKNDYQREILLENREIRAARLILWRRDPVVKRIERPTSLSRARSLGYRAKPGIILARIRVPRGSRRKSAPNRGRRSKRTGVTRITPKKSRQAIAEGRVQRYYTNLNVLNSYWVAQDGAALYYEVILVDPYHPVVIADHRLNWMCPPYLLGKDGKRSKHRGRAHRGLTSVGKRHRGLRAKGMNASHLRR